MQKFNRLADLLKNDLNSKKVLLRADLNVPVKAGKVSDATRIIGLVPTIFKLLEKKAKVIIISHFGRPEGKYNSNYSLSSIVDDVAFELKNYSGKVIDVKFGVDCVGSAAKDAVSSLEAGSVLILENLRFHAEEEINDQEFCKKLAEMADFYINDAFSCSHRAHSSIYGVAKLIPAFAGLLLEKEVDCLSKALLNPERPMGAIVGGSKISSKIDLLYSLTEKADYLFIGGGMANTFLYAKGVDVGNSLCEKDLKKKALEILNHAQEKKCNIMLPIDVTVASSINEGNNCRIYKSDQIPSDKMALDIGTQTLCLWNEVISKCKTLIWNGPVGAIEFPPFDNGSIGLARSVAYYTQNCGLNSVAGGGDTVALINASGLKDSLSYISTAGGAFLEWLEGKNLPGIKALIDSANKSQAA
jgi:phosphoglycerate kinase